MGADGKNKGKLIEQKTKIFDKSGNEVKLNYLISDAGGQGDVYHVSFKGHDYALKWYCKQADDVIGENQYHTILNIHGEEKKPSEKFIWPLIMVTEKDKNFTKGKKFGYLMEVLPKGYYEMEHFLRMDGDKKAVRFENYNALLVACMNIAMAMRKLHMRGWSYKDLNPKNFSINPATGDVLVVDNDNVSVDNDPCTVKGMRGYMAPEIPRSKYEASPTTETDYFSLAVVLYRLLFVDHPMEGKAWEKYPLCTEKVEDYLYAIKPVFHFDPQNDSNRPTEVFAPNAKLRWYVMPHELRQLFVVSFTEGIDHPNERITEYGWIDALAKTRDKLIRLNSTREQFVNFTDVRSVPPRCLGLKIGRNVLAVYPQKALYEICIDNNVQQYGTLMGGITYDKKTDQMMLRNVSNKIWRCYSPVTKQVVNIGKGQEHPLFPGVMIEFQRENPRIVGDVFDPRKK